MGLCHTRRVRNATLLPPTHAVRTSGITTTPPGPPAPRKGRLRIEIVAVAVAAGIVLTLSACGRPAEPYQPTLPSIDFTPKLVITVDDTGLRPSVGPRSDPDVQLDPLTLREGSVVEIVNGGSRDHRVKASGLVDTGVMRPGERVTLGLTKELTEDTAYELRDLADPTHTLGITVKPRLTPR